MELHEGQIVEGLFQVVKKGFKRGGAGEIHLAKDHSGRTVVLKFPLQDGIAKNPEQFKREYQTLLKFAHPNVARVFHFGQHENRFFIVYEYIEGEQFTPAIQGLPMEKVDLLLIKVLEALEAIHIEGMLHLDVKSSNVLVTKNGEVKLVDFGLAVAKEELNPKTVCGSIQYMAPEMVLKKGVDNRADLFQFGVLAYHAYTNEYPFAGRERIEQEFLKAHAEGGVEKRKEGLVEKMREIVFKESLPEKPSLYNIDCKGYHDEIVLKCLEPDPMNRFGSARAVINAFKSHHPEDYAETPESRGSYLIPEGDQHIGRVKEQKLLHESFRELLAGQQPQNAVFWISGPDGVGKSHFLEKAKERMERVLENVSLHFLEVPKEAAQMLTGGVDWADEWCQCLNRRLLENQKPVAVMIDNADSIQEGSKLKQILAKNCDKLCKRKTNEKLFGGQMPLLFCFTSGREYKNAPGLKGVYPDPVEFHLKPFSFQEVKSYLLKTPALRHKEIPQSWLKAVYSKTEGNPNELAELLKEQDRAGILLDLHQDVLMARVEDTSIDFEEEVPVSTKTRLQNFLSALSDPERRVVQWIAVWCYREVLKTIRPNDLQALMTHNHLLPLLNALVSKKILIRDGKQDAYSFPEHSYLPNIVYAETDSGTRAEMHEAVCKYLKKARGNDSAYYDAMLLHQAYGNPGVLAFRAVLNLGRKNLFECGKSVLARELFERGLEMAPPGNGKLKSFLAIKCAEACFYSGKYSQALSLYPDWKENIPVLYRIMFAAAILSVLLETRQFQKADEVIKEGLALCDKTTSSFYKAVLTNFSAEVFYKKFYAESRGDSDGLQEAKRLYERGEALEADLDSRQKDLVRNNHLGLLLHALGENERAIDKLEAKRRKLKRNPNIFGELVVLLTMAEAYRHLKFYDKAFACANEAAELAKKTNSAKWIFHAHHIHAAIFYSKGNALAADKKYSEAENQFRLALKEHDCCLAASACFEGKEEAALNAVATFIRRGQCYEELKEWNSAYENFNAALYSNPSGVHQCLAHLGLSRSYIARGDLKRAEEYLNGGEEFIAKLPANLSRHYAFEVYRTRVKLFLKQKDGERASGYLAKMKTLSEQDASLKDDFRIFERELR